MAVEGATKVKGLSVDVAGIHLFERSAKGVWGLRTTVTHPWRPALIKNNQGDTWYDMADFQVEANELLIAGYAQNYTLGRTTVTVEAYERSGTGLWRHRQSLRAPEMGGQSLMGGLRLILKDRLAVLSLPGSLFSNAPAGNGVIHAFLRLDGAWAYAKSLQGEKGFGSALQLVGPEEELWVGSPGEGNPAFPRSGAIRLHEVRLTPTITVHDGEAGSSPLVASGATVDLGQAEAGRGAERILRVVNRGHGPLLLTGLTVDDPRFEAAWLNGPEVAVEAEGQLRVRFQSSELGSATANLQFHTNDPEMPLFELTLTAEAQAEAEAPVVVTLPVARIVPEGEALLWRVEATGTEPMRYQWRKDGRNISGANDRAFVMQAGLASAGNYTVEVRNGTGRVVSAAVPLAVVRRWAENRVANVDGSLALSVLARGPGLGFQWKKDGMSLPGEDRRISGATTGTLRLSALTAADAGQYVLDLSLGAVTLSEVVNAGVTIRQRPVVTPLADADLWLGESWQRTLTVSSAPTRYLITGLPPGIVFTQESATLSGNPRQAGRYRVRVRAVNEAGMSGEEQFEIRVTEPEGMKGAYVGTVAPVANSDFRGGWVRLAISGSAVMTGEVRFGSHRYRVRQPLIANPQGDDQVILSTGGHFLIAQGWLMRVTFNPSTQTFQGDVRLTNNGLILEVKGVRSSRHGWEGLPVTQAGRHTVALLPPLTAGGPLGAVHGVFVVKQDGRVSWSGKLGDGTPVTAASALGLNGHLPLHLTTTASRGTAQVWLQVGDEVVTKVNAEASFWAKAQATKPQRSHPQGFYLNDMQVRGGRYEAPPPDAMLFDSPNPPATLLFGADFTSTFASVAPNWQQALDASRPDKLTVSVPDARNLRVTISRARGTFQGSWNEGGRRASFEGVLIPSLKQGWGHTLLDLPTSFAAKVGGKAAQVSGQVRIE